MLKIIIKLWDSRWKKGESLRIQITPQIVDEILNRFQTFLMGPEKSFYGKKI
jgi:hypothetical protein